MEIYFEDGQAVSEEIRKTMERAACRCLETEGVDGQRAELSVTFVDPEEIRVLNRDYRTRLPTCCPFLSLKAQMRCRSRESSAWVMW